MPYILGLTGGIGSGKSTASMFFARHGFQIIDADILTRNAHRRPDICKALAQCFGQDILQYQNNIPTLNRAILGARAFESLEKTNALNQIMAPALDRLLDEALKKFHGQNCIIDAALLFESRWDRFASKSIAVLSPERERIARVQARSRLPVSQIRARMQSQTNDADRRRHADFILYNTGTTSQLEQQVIHIIHGLDIE